MLATNKTLHLSPPLFHLPPPLPPCLPSTHGAIRSAYAAEYSPPLSSSPCLRFSSRPNKIEKICNTSAHTHAECTHIQSSVPSIGKGRKACHQPPPPPKTSLPQIQNPISSTLPLRDWLSPTPTQQRAVASYVPYTTPLTPHHHA